MLLDLILTESTEDILLLDHAALLDLSNQLCLLILNQIELELIGFQINLVALQLFLKPLKLRLLLADLLSQLKHLLVLLLHSTLQLPILLLQLCLHLLKFLVINQFDILNILGVSLPHIINGLL